MADFEVYIENRGSEKLVGRCRANRARGKEVVLFEYAEEWLESPEHFELEPALPLGPGTFAPPAGRTLHGSIGDSSPDTWGRRLMQRAERRRAATEGREVKTLMESDYLLGVTDLTRLGALRFRLPGSDHFLASPKQGVPSIVELGRLLQTTERIFRDEDTDEDLQLIFAPGSSLGGARPKASVIDQHGQLAIAKFPKESDEYSIETWEEVALQLAEKSGIPTPEHELIQVAGKSVLLSRRFDREETNRIPFLSAMALLGAKDGETGSYPEMVDVLGRYGSQAKKDAHGLFRRVVFNVLISNLDDHLRNHGFLRKGNDGWTLSPAYDLNPVPADLKARVLTTNISLDEGTCSLDLLEESTQYFALSLRKAREIIKEVAIATSTWRSTAMELGIRPTEIERMASAFEHSIAEKAARLPCASISQK